MINCPYCDRSLTSLFCSNLSCYFDFIIVDDHNGLCFGIDIFDNSIESKSIDDVISYFKKLKKMKAFQ